MVRPSNVYSNSSMIHFLDVRCQLQTPLIIHQNPHSSTQESLLKMSALNELFGTIDSHYGKSIRWPGVLLILAIPPFFCGPRFRSKSSRTDILVGGTLIITTNILIVNQQLAIFVFRIGITLSLLYSFGNNCICLRQISNAILILQKIWFNWFLCSYSLFYILVQKTALRTVSLIMHKNFVVIGLIFSAVQFIQFNKCHNTTSFQSSRWFM